MLAGSTMAADQSLTEFAPKDSEKLDWRVVDDGVMGGLSQGNLTVSDAGILKFEGDLSLENNGGFSSLRTGNVDFDLSGAEGLVARVKGDGRTYQLRLGTDARYRGREVSFSAEFPTTQGEWTEVRVPFSQFVASFRGMKLKDEEFDAGEIRRLGLLLGDKKAGPFELQVDWIRSYGTDASSIVDQALADGRFGTLATALTKADLVDVLKSDGPFTVFAPTDEAFAKLPPGTVKELLKPENREKLRSILTYHVSPGRISAGDALNAKSAKTVNGKSVNFAIEDGLLKVNGATILTTDIECANGVIHVIDAVLSPPVGEDETTESKAKPDLSPERRIEAAIEEGVPVFNEGDHAKCAEIYQECLVSLAGDERIDGTMGSALKDLIARGKEETSDFERAWLYRRGLDRIYASLVNP